jgi:hypothetical protein
LAVGFLLTPFVNRYRVVVVTDRTISILDSGRLLPWTPRR